MPAGEVLDLYQPPMDVTRYHGDAFPQWWPNFGPGIGAGFLGAKVVPQPETVWYEPEVEIAPAELHLSFDPDNIWWKRVCELTALAAERWQGKAVVGYTDIGGNLDILASLRTTEKLLMETFDAPEEIDRLASEVTKHWLLYFEELHKLTDAAGRGHSTWAGIWSAGRTYMLQCDFSYMISPDMFERWVLPDLTTCCEHLDHSFYHLDGPGELAHLDHLCNMPELNGIQWIPGAGQKPPVDWPEVIDKIISSGKLCQIFGSAEDALKIVRRHGGKGFQFGVGGTDGWSDKKIADFLAEIQK